MSAQEENGGTVWVVTIDGPVNTSTLLFSTRFQYPNNLGPIERIHVSSNNTLYAIMTQGVVVSIDPKTGTVSDTIGGYSIILFFCCNAFIFISYFHIFLFS